MAVELADISNNDGTINWDRVSGVAGVICKATEGRTFDDPLFGSYRDNAHRHTLLVGAYHFARPSNQPGVRGAQVEANHFLNVVRAIPQGELPPTLDFEDPNAQGQLDDWVQTWLDTVEHATGRTPIIYTYWSYWTSHIAQRDRFARYPLWIAAYQASPPRIPCSWTFWQHTDHGSVPGITPQVDLDTFNGTQDDLNRLAGLGQHPKELEMITTVLATPEGVTVPIGGIAGDLPVDNANRRSVSATKGAEQRVWQQEGLDGHVRVFSDPAGPVDFTFV